MDTTSIEALRNVPMLAEARMGKLIFGNTHLEELPKALFTSSTDMVSGEMTVHRRGPMWTAIGASISSAGMVDPEELPRVAAVIRPDVSLVGLLELGRIDAAIEAGPAATRAVLDANPELVG